MLKPMENNYREVKSLDGLWAFWVDFDGVGYKKGYFKGLPPEVARPITVPSSYNDIFSDPRIKNHVGDVWYERRVLVPRSYGDRRVVLRFGSVSHHATVWIDGFEVAHHYGGFTPFEIDITHLVRAGNYFTIVVCCNNDLFLETSKLGLAVNADPSTASSENRNLSHISSASAAPLSPFPSGFNFAGIQRSVQLVYTPYQFIDDLTVVHEVSPDLKKAKVQVSLFARDMAGSNLNSQQLSPLMRRRLEIKKYELDRQRFVLTSFNLKLTDLKGNVVAEGHSAVVPIAPTNCRHCPKRFRCARSPFKVTAPPISPDARLENLKHIVVDSSAPIGAEAMISSVPVAKTVTGVAGNAADFMDNSYGTQLQVVTRPDSHNKNLSSKERAEAAVREGERQERLDRAKAISGQVATRAVNASGNTADYAGYADGSSNGNDGHYYENCGHYGEGTDEEAIMESGLDAEPWPDIELWSFKRPTSDDKEAEAIMAEHVSLEGCKYRGKVTLQVTNPILWQPGDSYLYFLEVELKSGDLTVDSYTLRVGIRSVEIKGQQLFINHKPFYMKGVSRTEDSELRGQAFDYVTMIHDQSLMGLLGANAFRTAHNPFSEEQMDYADYKGLVVIDEAPALCWYRPELINERVQLAHKKTIAELINRDKNHPCVVMWSIATEPDGALADKNSQDGADGLLVRNYLQPIVSYARRLDSTRPLTLVNMQDARSNEALVDLFDVLCVKFCDSDLSKQIPAQDLALLTEYLRQEILPWFAYKKPVMISEYGVDTLAGFYSVTGERGSEEFQIKWLELCHQVFKDNVSIVGEFLTFADINPVLGVRRDSRKGIFTRDRHPKSAVFTLTEHFSSMG